jgi:hypothetical protein
VTPVSRDGDSRAVECLIKTRQRMAHVLTFRMPLQTVRPQNGCSVRRRSGNGAVCRRTRSETSTHHRFAEASAAQGGDAWNLSCRSISCAIAPPILLFKQQEACFDGPMRAGEVRRRGSSRRSANWIGSDVARFAASFGGSHSEVRRWAKAHFPFFPPPRSCDELRAFKVAQREVRAALRCELTGAKRCLMKPCEGPRQRSAPAFG